MTVRPAEIYQRYSNISIFGRCCHVLPVQHRKIESFSLYQISKEDICLPILVSEWGILHILQQKASHNDTLTRTNTMLMNNIWGTYREDTGNPWESPLCSRRPRWSQSLGYCRRPPNAPPHRPISVRRWIPKWVPQKIARGSSIGIWFGGLSYSY